MADKVEKTEAVLPLSVVSRKTKARAAPPLLPGVRDVILWTLFHAGVFPFSMAVSYAYYMVITTIFSHPASWLLPGHMEMMDAEETVADALVNGILSCAAPQAAAAALALMLPRHRRRLRLLLAYAALVATFASHCMVAGATRMFGAADPGGLGLYFRTFGTASIFILGVGDLICFMGLVLRGGEE